MNYSSSHETVINPPRPSLIDLYSGIGGLGLGGARAGFNIELSVDIDPVLLGIHETNFPSTRHLCADVSQLSGSRILEAAGLAPGNLSALVGGSPCQGFSRIGRRCKDDHRNSLFVEFFRLVSEMKPAFFIAENVPGILDAQNSQLITQGIDYVRSEYNLLEPAIFDASDYGAATVRKRVFIIGYQADKMERISIEDFERDKCESRKTVEEALVGLPKKIKHSWSTDSKGWRKLRKTGEKGFWQKVVGEIPNGVGDSDTIAKLQNLGIVSGCIGTEHEAAVLRRFAKIGEGEVEGISRAPRLSRKGQCPTLRAGTGKDKGSFQALRPIHFAENRVITPREAARLQGFPDWFRLHKTKWHSFRGIGNSVSPLLAECILRVLKGKLKDDCASAAASVERVYHLNRASMVSSAALSTS